MLFRSNDYDPDGDAIEVNPDSGSTAAGGTYAVNLAGNVTYTPPSALYNGVDYFYYACRDVVQPSLADAAQVRILVGNVTLGSVTYVKLVERNHRETNNGSIQELFGDFYLQFWADPAATIPKIPSPSISVNVRRIYETWNAGTWVVQTNTVTAVASGNSTDALVFSGQYFYMWRWAIEFGWRRRFSLEPGTDYIPI